MVLIDRRSVLVGCAAVAAPGMRSCSFAAAAPSSAELDRLAALEKRHGGRLGVSVFDAATGRRVARRGSERFAMCSTFKFLAAAFVLARVDRDEERLDRRVVFSTSELVAWSPVTKQRVSGDGMTVEALCEAAMTLSDNTAANLLLASFGGPAGLTAYLRTIGDETTRLDRFETALNEARRGDPRDTTTPDAMLETMRRILLGNALSNTSRDKLIAWMIANRTGDRRLRATLRPGWRIGDRTGTGGNGAANVIAVLWPPGRAPVLVAAYFAEARASDEQREAVLAEIGRIVAGT